MDKNFNMVATHSIRTVQEDKIFKANSEATQAVKLFGSDNVINASIGVLLDDEGKLALLPTVMDTLKTLRPEDFAAVSPIGGSPDFLEAIKKSVFRDCVPDGYINAIATPGVSAAIRNAIWNYSEHGDVILTSDYHWGVYKTITEENGRRLDYFTMFDQEYKFNISSFEQKVKELLDKQKRIVILVNSPGNNPSGYSMTDNEWENAIEMLKEHSKEKDNKIILVLDFAYIDFGKEGNESRKFIAKLGNLPENILTIIAYSMSKSFTLYGMRTGAMIGISSNEVIAREFKAVNEFSNRGIWSYGTRAAMVLLPKIMNDNNLFKKVEEERKILKNLINSRAMAFMEESRRIGLPNCPFESGFFVTIPCSNPIKEVEKMKDNLIFTVAMSKGIRFGVCSVTEEKCRIAPAIISKTFKL